jgi:hypothetical protein
MSYTTPPGVNERLVAYPVEYSDAQIEQMKKLGIKFLSWGDHAFAYGRGLGTSFFDEISMKRRMRKSIIIVVTGDAGIGKTWQGIRIGEILDKKFNVQEQVTFDRPLLLKHLGPDSQLRAGQVILIDEAHFAAGSRSWSEAGQRELMNIIAAARFRGFIFIIVALDKSMLDKILREYLIGYWVKMIDRGFGIAYRTTTRGGKEWLHRFGELHLKMPSYELCSNPDCLKCRYLGKCGVPRAHYEKKKKTFFDARIGDYLQRDKVRRAKEVTLPPDEELMEMIWEHRDEIEYTNRNTIDKFSIMDIGVKIGHRIERNKAGELAKRIIRRFPDLDRRKMEE